MPFPGTQNLPLQFSGGLNSKVQEFSLDQPNLQTANNVIYNELGAIDKRTGVTATSNVILGGGVIEAGQAITTFNGELLVLQGSNLYSYDKSNNVWIDKGSLFATTNAQTRVINTKIATQSNPDCTTLDGIQLYLWEDNRPVPVSTGAGIRYSVIDVNTNNFLVSDKFVYPFGRSCKVLGSTLTNLFYMFYSGATNILCMNTVNANNPELLSPFTQLFVDGYSPGNSNFIYDAFEISEVPIIIYSSTAGINVGVPTSVPFSSNLIAGTWATCIAATQAGVNSWIAYTDAIKGGTWVYNVTTTVLLQIDTLSAVNIAVIEDTTAGNVNVTYEIQGTGTGFNYIKNASVATTGSVTANFTQRKVGLASKPFKVGDDIFVNAVGFTNLQSTYFTMCVTSFSNFNCTAVAKHAPSNGGNYRTNNLLSQCDPVSTNTFVFAGQRKGPFQSFQNSQTVNLGVAGYTIDFINSNAFNSVNANNNLHIVGGVKKIYDGVSVVEDNFHYFPEDATDGNSCYVNLHPGGNLTYNPLTVPNLYQYLIVYEWTDNYGQVQRSGPGVAVSVVTTTTGQGAALIIPTLTITDKVNARSPVSISIYRTQDSLPIFYKITDDDNPLVNDTSVDYVTYFDELSDNAIGANENLYIGTQLGNSGPPACSLISLYQNRLFINTTEDPNVLWYSQNKFEQDQYNTLPLDFNTSFTEGVDSRLGTSITAIGLLDNSLAIFKETSIFLLQGDGPNSLDTSGQFNDAQLLVSDTGCNNPNSLVFITQTPKLPGGLLFKSDKGIYLLGRDTSLYYIGAPVEKYNNLTITAAVLIADKNQVVFTTLEGTALVYNYYFDAWTTWTQLPAISATVWENQLTILTPQGQVLVQDITNTIYSDTFGPDINYPVQMTITTPWIKLGGLQGYQAVFNCLILGTLQGPHILNVGCAFNLNPAIVTSVDINSSVATNRWGSLPLWGSPGMWGDNQFSNYQYQVNFTSPYFRCQAVQLTLTDIDPDENAAFSLNGLLFEVLGLPGQVRLPAANMAGSH